MRFAAMNPDRVMLCRGNHEERETWFGYSLRHEIDRKFKEQVH